MDIFRTRKKEKRIYPRIPFWTKVRVDLVPQQLNGGVKSDTLGVENLSQGGILVETSHPYPLDTPCRIFIREKSYSRELVLEGFVVRSASSRRGKFFDTGICFSSLNPEQENSLAKIIKLYTPSQPNN